MTVVELEPATIDDLLRYDGKAELIDGRIVPMMAVGHLPNRVSGIIYYYLLGHTMKTQRGFAYCDAMGFAVPRLRSGRQSFSPDVSFYDGPAPKNPMRFVEGPPTFAVEVRSENDYGPAADGDIAAKRADYFEAGTLIVWDVDTQRKCINAYSKASPNSKQVFSLGQTADAEPAVPGWQIEVDRIFKV